MPKQALENLTEAMFYTLMALTRGDACGTEITAFAAEFRAGRCGWDLPPCIPCWLNLKKKAF